MTAKTTSSRLLALLALLQSRRERTGPELAARLSVSIRTVRRDVDRLRALGYPVESAAGPAGGYRLGAGAAMPPLLLDDEEAVAMAVGLRTAARSGITGIGETALQAMVKLEQVLPPRLRGRVQALAAISTTLSPGGPTVDPEVLAVLAGACRDHERVRFDYRDRAGARGRREAEPHALVHHHNRWYLLAWDLRRDGWRTFRLDRLARPWPGGARFAPRPVPGGDPAGYVAAALKRAPYRWSAEVTLFAPARALEGMPYLWGTLEPVDDGACRYRTADDDLDWLAMRLGMIGVEFRIDSPPELARRVAAIAARLHRAAGEAAAPRFPPVGPGQVAGAGDERTGA